MTKTFILRPNALLSSSEATLKFGSNNVVVIPMAVLDEVHNMKNLSPEKAKIRRELFEYLRGFNFGELSTDGVKQKNGSLLKIVKNFKEESLGIWEEDSNLSTFQKRTLRVCTGLKRTGANVILVTNNPCLQMVAEDIGINTFLAPESTQTCSTAARSSTLFTVPLIEISPMIARPATVGFVSAIEEIATRVGRATSFVMPIPCRS